MKWGLVWGRKMKNSAKCPCCLSRQPQPGKSAGVSGAPLCRVPQLCFNFFIVRLCLELLFQLLEEQTKTVRLGLSFCQGCPARLPSAHFLPQDLPRWPHTWP